MSKNGRYETLAMDGGISELQLPARKKERKKEREGLDLETRVLIDKFTFGMN